MKLNSIVRKLAIPLAIATAASFTPREAKARNWSNERASARIGLNIPVEQYGNVYAPGFAAALDYKLSKPRASLGIGGSVFHARGDHVEDSKYRFFTDPDDDSFDETLWDLSLNLEGLLHLRPNIKYPDYSPSLFLGGGLRQNFVWNSGHLIDEDRDAIENSTERDFLDSQPGYYFVLGLDKHFGDGVFGYFRLEPRFTFEDGYKGMAGYIGLDVPLEDVKR